MPKFEIKYGIGFDSETQIVEADNIEEAQDIAYQEAMGIARMEMHYSATEYIEDDEETDEE
jgi:hypothetical protein